MTSGKENGRAEMKALSKKRDYAIEVRGLSKRFKGRTVLDSVSLAVEKGEIFGILGPNGAGKTTIVNCICGLVSPDSGDCLVFGKNTRSMGKRIFEEINFVSGNSAFHRKETPIDILSFYSGVYENPENTGKLVELFGIAPFLDREFGSLSTGQKSRVLLAKALINRPKILILDEPTLGLDPDISKTVREMIWKVSAEGTTVLLTSHYMNEIEELCRRIAFVSKGRILDIGSVSRLKKSRLGRKATFRFVLSKCPVSRREAGLKNLMKQGFSFSNGVVSKTGFPGDVLEIISQIRKSGLSFDEFDLSKPNLEDYFLEMTRISDEEAP